MSSTANPRAPKPEDVGIPQEPTGPVAADSLAAESLQNQGGFSENSNAAAMGVRGDQSTLNNTDTSGATALPPATDGLEREKNDALGAGADEKGVAGLKYPDAAGKAEFSGHHSHTGAYSGGGSSAFQSAGSGSGPAGASDFGASTVSSSGGIDESQIRSGDAATKGASTSSGTSADAGSGASGSGPATGTGVRPHVDAAPGYTATVTGPAMPENTFKPKGANLEDADVTESMPQTKTFTGAIGTVNDPGRLAEREFEGRNDDPVGELGQSGTESGRARQKGEESRAGETGQYGVLQSERA